MSKKQNSAILIEDDDSQDFINQETLSLAPSSLPLKSTD